MQRSQTCWIHETVYNIKSEMKFVFCLLVVLPLALCAPLTAEEENFDKRFIFGSFQLPSAHELGQEIMSLLGSDTSEAACETACGPALSTLIPGAGALAGPAVCGPACHWVQKQVQG